MGGFCSKLCCGAAVEPEEFELSETDQTHATVVQELPPSHTNHTNLTTMGAPCSNLREPDEFELSETDQLHATVVEELPPSHTNNTTGIPPAL